MQLTMRIYQVICLIQRRRIAILYLCRYRHVNVLQLRHQEQFRQDKRNIRQLHDVRRHACLVHQPGVGSAFGKVVRLGKLYGSFRRGRMLGSVGTAFRGKGAGLVVKRDNSKGAMLVGYVINLLAPSGKRLLCSRHGFLTVKGGRGGTLHQRVKVVFRDTTLFSSVAMLSGIVFPLGVFDGSALHSQAHHTVFYLRHMGLVRTGSGFPKRVDNNVRGHMTVTHTVTLGPRCLFYSRPGSKLSPGASLIVSRLVRSVAQRCGVAALVGARSVGSMVNVKRGVVCVCRKRGR